MTQIIFFLLASIGIAKLAYLLNDFDLEVESYTTRETTAMKDVLLGGFSSPSTTHASPNPRH